MLNEKANHGYWPRRPFAVLGAGAFIGSIAAAQASFLEISIAVGCCGLIVLILAAVNRNCRRLFPAVLMALTVAFIVSAFYKVCWNLYVEPFQAMDGCKFQARILIRDYPEERYDRFYYQAQVTMLDYQPVKPFNIRLTCAEGLYCYPGDIVECELGLYSFSSRGIFSAQNSQAAQGNVMGAYLSGYSSRTVRNLSRPLGLLLVELRSFVGRSISRYLSPDSGGMVRAIFLGQRYLMPEISAQDFRQLGCSHLLATSGLHMSAIMWALTLFIERLPLGYKARNRLKALAILFYLPLTGYPVSAVRSVVMALLFLAAENLDRQADSRNSLGAAALGICLLRPFSGGDMRFVLSVLSTAGLVIMYRPLYQRMIAPLRKSFPLQFIMKPVIASVSTSLCVMCFTMPVQLLAFGGIPLMAIPANFLLVPAVTVLIYFSVALAVAAPLAPAAMVRPIAFCTELSARFSMDAAKALSDSVPLTFYNLERSSLPLILVIFLVITGMVRLLDTLRGSSRRRGLTFGLLAILALSLGINLDMAYAGSLISILIYGDSSSFTVAVASQGHAAILCTGGYMSGIAEQILLDNNIYRLDTLLIPKQDPEALRMVDELLEVRRPERLLLPEGAYSGGVVSSHGLSPACLALPSGYQAIPGVWVEISEDGKRLAFTANGVRTIVELSASEPESCDLLITGQPDSQIAAGAAMLFTGKDKDVSPESGWTAYLPLSDEDYYRIDIDNGGRLSIAGAAAQD